MMDRQGHVVLTDFGVADRLVKKRKGALKGETGTTGYMAPELKNKERYRYSVDIFSFGIIVHEFISGKRPFPKDADPRTINPVISRKLSSTATNFVKRLLTKDPTKRLGCGKKGIAAIRRHKFFRGTDWAKVLNKEIEPPFRPVGEANFAGDANVLDQLDFQGDKKPPLAPEQQKLFADFEFCTD
eukprot:844875_1